MVDVVIAGNDGKMLEARAQIRAGGEKAVFDQSDKPKGYRSCNEEFLREAP
jgi:hypothetical protein